MSTVSEPIQARAGQRKSRPLTGAQAVAEVIAAQERPIVYGIPDGYTMQVRPVRAEHGRSSRQRRDCFIDVRSVRDRGC